MVKNQGRNEKRNNTSDYYEFILLLLLLLLLLGYYSTCTQKFRNIYIYVYVYLCIYSGMYIFMYKLYITYIHYIYTQINITHVVWENNVYNR